jgi:hypothetical protein
MPFLIFLLLLLCLSRSIQCVRLENEFAPVIFSLKMATLEIMAAAMERRQAACKQAGLFEARSVDGLLPRTCTHGSEHSGGAREAEAQVKQVGGTREGGGEGGEEGAGCSRCGRLEEKLSLLEGKMSQMQQDMAALPHTVAGQVVAAVTSLVRAEEPVDSSPSPHRPHPQALSRDGEQAPSRAHTALSETGNETPKETQRHSYTAGAEAGEQVGKEHQALTKAPERAVTTTIGDMGQAGEAGEASSRRPLEITMSPRARVSQGSRDSLDSLFEE